MRLKLLYVFGKSTNLRIRNLFVSLGLLFAVGCSNSGSLTVDSSASNFCLKAVTQTSGYSSGDGSVESPYYICKSTELAHLMSTPTDWSANFKLLADVDLTSVAGVAPIGKLERTSGGVTLTSNPFTGTFDGAGKTIRGLHIDQSNNYNLAAGLFGYIQNASVHDVKLLNAAIVAINFSGIAVGLAENSDVYNVAISGSSINWVSTSTGTGTTTGGVVGYYNVTDGSSRIVSGCVVNLTATAFDLFAPLIGKITSNTGSTLEIKNNQVTAVQNPVAAGGNTFGGFVGFLDLDSSTLNIHNNKVDTTLNLTNGGSFSGGLAGTLVCETCSVRFANNSIQMQWTNPGTFNVGFVGGLFGITDIATTSQIDIRQNQVTGFITVPNVADNRAAFGGLIGYASFDNGAVVSLVNNAARVSLDFQSIGSNRIGGLVGMLGIRGTAVMDFENNYSVGTDTSVAPGGGRGGLIGDLTLTGTLDTKSSHSYFSSDDYALGIGNYGAVAYVTGLPRSQMTDSNSFVGWDFTSIWNLSGTFPYLRN